MKTSSVTKGSFEGVCPLEQVDYVGWWRAVVDIGCGPSQPALSLSEDNGWLSEDLPDLIPEPMVEKGDFKNDGL
jgi:hypothetical protein